MKPTKDVSARSLAELHFHSDNDIAQIFRLTSPNEEHASEPIKLLEINPATAESGVMPVSFGPTERIPYPYVVVEVTPDEFQQIQQNSLPLPPNWKVGERLFERKNGAR